MNSEFDYSQRLYNDLRTIFDNRYNHPIAENIIQTKYAKYLDNDMNEHIVSFLNCNQFSESIYNKNLKELQTYLNQLKTNDNSQIHIVCTDYICSHKYGDYYYSQIQKGIKYYYCVLNLFDAEIPPIKEITNYFKKYSDRKLHLPRNFSNDDNDPYSESTIMRDLMNGEGEKHGFD